MGDQPLSHVLDCLQADLGTVTFLQIGSNDASFGDHVAPKIRQYNWSGIMVEPVPYVFRRLAEKWKVPAKAKHIRLMNVAVDRAAGVKPFYYVKQVEHGDPVPEWYDQIGSFHREVLMKHAKAIRNLKQRIVVEDVPCVTVDSLLINNPRLLHIDTEGHDYVILQSIDFTAARPALIIYEHAHLSENDKSHASDLLVLQGYGVCPAAYDTFAVNIEDERLVRTRRVVREINPSSWRAREGA